MPTMNRLHKTLTLVACLFGLAALALPASNIRADGATVIVNERQVLTFRTSVDNHTPAQRAERLANNLRRLPALEPIALKKVGTTHWITIGGQNLIPISPAEASAQKGTTANIATLWAGRLREAASLPPLRVSENTTRLAEGATRDVNLVGSRAFDAQVRSEHPDVATVTRTRTGLQIRGVGRGVTTLRVGSMGFEETILVEVRPFAASFPQTVAATISGHPASESMVRGAIEGALRTQFQSENGARLNFQVGNPGTMGSGQTRTFPVQVRAEAPGAIERAGTVNVVIRNTGAKLPRETELWYCNEPENVTRPGNLFAAKLREGRPARMLYHHINESPHPLFLRIQIVNDSDEAAQVKIVPGDSDPDKNPVRAGLLAADQFVRDYIAGSAEVVTIPPRSSMPISIRRMSPKETISGLCTLVLMDGPKELLVRTDAWPPFNLDERGAAALLSAAPWRILGCRPINALDQAPYELSSHIYPDPFMKMDVDYQVGGRFGFIRIGQQPISRKDNIKRLDGNFGVVYNIDAVISNPTPIATDVEVVFEASAGYSGALFVLNGSYLRTPLLQPKTESRIARIRLEPGASRTLTMLTIPLSGSSYPSTVIIRPVQAAEWSQTPAEAIRP
jgi:hypothetical protein